MTKIMKQSKNLTFLHTNISLNISFINSTTVFFFDGLNTVPVRHSKINENKNAMKEIQNRDWQDFVESVIKPVEHDKSHLKQLPKAERKIIKSIRYNYRVTRSVYTSTH